MFSPIIRRASASLKNCIRFLTAAPLAMADYKKAHSIYDFTVKDIKGQPVSLEKYRGHVCIIVNVASQCGYTKTHYDQLVVLYEQYHDSKGLCILAFPCNQFGNQEPGSNEEICEFVSKKNVKFDMFDKINVNGDEADPLFKYLKHKQGGIFGSFIKWNFTKFIIDRNGQPVERHGPNTSPKDLVKALEKYCPSIAISWDKRILVPLHYSAQSGCIYNPSVHFKQSIGEGFQIV